MSSQRPAPTDTIYLLEILRFIACIGVTSVIISISSPTGETSTNATKSHLRTFSAGFIAMAGRGFKFFGVSAERSTLPSLFRDVFLASIQ